MYYYLLFISTCDNKDVCQSFYYDAIEKAMLSKKEDESKQNGGFCVITSPIMEGWVENDEIVY